MRGPLTVSEMLDEAFRVCAAQLAAARVCFVEGVLALVAVPATDEAHVDD